MVETAAYTPRVGVGGGAVSWPSQCELHSWAAGTAGREDKRKFSGEQRQPRLGLCSVPVLPAPRAAGEYPSPQLQGSIKNPFQRGQEASQLKEGPVAPLPQLGARASDGLVSADWKPLGGGWCPSGWPGRWEVQAWKDALTTRPFSGCGGRKLFTM